ncbi:MAG: cyclic nucleotide-binding domain-containing protein [Actinobacteria bacterium]|nr:MAG: cyclic nucleotide-binding domain-containing protein [Actinomycetota bacterium]
MGAGRHDGSDPAGGAKRRRDGRAGARAPGDPRRPLRADLVPAVRCRRARLDARASAWAMMLVERVAALHEVDLFSAVPGRMLASVAATAEEVTVEPGSTFIEHGAVEDCLYVVVSGRVRVHHGGQVFAELGAGSSVGELAVLVPGARARHRGNQGARPAPAGACRCRRRRLRRARVNQAGRVVRLLAAQAFVFGLSGSLLVIASSAIFLAAYGSKWLPLTFVAIALFGTLIAAWIARVVRHRPLPHVAILVESVVGLFFFGAWAVLTLWSGVFVSAPLLVLFPILLQVGFVFVGGQAGRLLDVQQIRIHFPRIVSGFAVGFVAGGLVAVPLLRLPGGTNGLFLIAAIAQVAFVMLLTVTAGRFAERLGQVERAPHGLPRPPLHRLLSSRFVLLLMAYQVLSAAGTYMAEYILFDRAAARFASADSLAQFLSRFTMVLVFAVAMLVSATSAGPESLALFALVASARIADVALTDGVTRASLNTSFQVLPLEDRLAVQSVVEGAGLPIAIGVTGVVLFALRTAGASVAVIIAVTVFVCIAWTAAAVLLYRDYARALVVALKHRLLRDAPVDVEHAETAAFLHEMLGSDDGRAVRLALDLLPSASEASGEHGELALLADDPRPDVYLPALVRLAETGDGEAQARLRKTVRTLLCDPDSSMRAEALAAIGPADVDLVDEVVTALEVPATMSAAAAALGRLGDAALPRIAAVLAETSEQPTPATVRLVRATRAASPDQAALIGRFGPTPSISPAARRSGRWWVPARSSRTRSATSSSSCAGASSHSLR